MKIEHLANADELKAIRQEREPLYGGHIQNHENIGLAWGGLLCAAGWTPPTEQDGAVEAMVPPDVVELALAFVKGIRAANRGAPFHADNYNDAVNYFQMAGEAKLELEG